jgi:enoyl-CoA hydratase/carnithine racemase
LLDCAPVFEDIRYDVSSGIATITLSRPDKLNALGARTYEELREAFSRAGADERVGVVVTKGEGRAFCAGGDIEMAQTLLTSEHAGRTHYFDRMIGVSDVVLSIGKPVLFAVHGACVGGGAELALFADLVIADETAYFVFNGTEIGGCSWWGGPQLLPLLVGMRRAEEIMYLSKRVRADEAAAIGLITRAVPAGELEAAADEVCQRILDLSEEGVRLTKAGLRSTKQLLLASMSAHAELNVGALGKPDLHAAFDAFLQGRKMSWRDLRPGFAEQPTAGGVRHEP